MCCNQLVPKAQLTTCKIFLNSILRVGQYVKNYHDIASTVNKCFMYSTKTMNYKSNQK